MWRPDRSSLKRPVYLSLADQIARAIDDGRLDGGGRLPTQRKLAQDLKISVQTVSRAYGELDRRGLISGEIGRGTFARAPQSELATPFSPERTGEVIDLSVLKPVCEPLHLNKMKAALARLADSLPASAVLSFRPNVVSGRHRASRSPCPSRATITANSSSADSQRKPGARKSQPSGAVSSPEAEPSRRCTFSSGLPAASPPSKPGGT